MENERLDIIPESTFKIELVWTILLFIGFVLGWIISMPLTLMLESVYTIYIIQIIFHICLLVVIWPISINIGLKGKTINVESANTIFKYLIILTIIAILFSFGYNLYSFKTSSQTYVNSFFEQSYIKEADKLAKEVPNAPETQKYKQVKEDKKNELENDVKTLFFPTFFFTQLAKTIAYLAVLPLANFELKKKTNIKKETEDIFYGKD